MKPSSWSVLLFSSMPALSKQDDQVVTVTASVAIPSNEPEWKEDDVFESAILNSTNTYRWEHDAKNVSWNGALATYASSYLDNNDCAFKHSGGPFGENLAMGYPNATVSVEAWGNERDEYHWDDPKFTEKTGHFSQLVWENTTDVGCGRRLCGEKGWYLVCEYWPRGNVAGEYKEEVGEERSGSRGLVRSYLWAVVAAFGVCALGWL